MRGDRGGPATKKKKKRGDFGPGKPKGGGGGGDFVARKQPPKTYESPRRQFGPEPKPTPTPAVKHNVVQGTKFNLPPWDVPHTKPPPRAPRRPQPLKPTLGETLYPAKPWAAPSPVTRQFVFKEPPAPLPTSRQEQKELDRQYGLALRAPVSHTARHKLGQAMTNEERQQYHQNLAPYRPPPPAPSKTLAGLPGWVPGAQSIPMVSHWLGNQGPFGQDINQILSGIPSVFAAGGEAIGKDLFDIGLGRPLPTRTLKLGGEMALGTGQGIYTTLGSPNLDPYRALAHGDWAGFRRANEAASARSVEQFKEHPVISALNVGALVAAPLRAASIGSLIRSIAEANPEMGAARILNYARKESYHPGYLAGKGIEGGIPARTLRATVEGGGAMETVGKPLASTPLGRAGQRIYDRHSARIDPNRAVIGRFSEQKRAVRQIAKRQDEAVQRAQILVQQTTHDIAKYVKGTRSERLAALASGKILGGQRARAAGVVYALQGPAGEMARNTLHAARDDLQEILDTGGKEIPSKTRLRVEKRMEALDRELGKMGLGVDENAPFWVDVRNVMHESGLSADEIETLIEGDKLAARAWAKEKPGRDPSDFQASPEGRNMAAFLSQLPEDGLAGILFQRPGWHADLIEPPIAPTAAVGDLIYDVDGTPMTITRVDKGGVEIQHPGGQTFEVPAEEAARLNHQSLQPGARVALHDARYDGVGTVKSIPAEGTHPFGAPVVEVTLDNGTTAFWEVANLEPPDQSVFYFTGARAVRDKWPQNMPLDSLIPWLTDPKRGVKPDEIAWTNMQEWLDALKAENPRKKTVTQQDVLDFYQGRNPFQLGLLHLSEEIRRRDGKHFTDHAYGGAQWSNSQYNPRKGDPGQREFLLVMGGEFGADSRPYQRQEHWHQTNNPILHIRVTHDPETNTLWINEVQTDWDTANRARKGSGYVFRPPGMTNKVFEKQAEALRQEAGALKRKNIERSKRILGLTGDEGWLSMGSDTPADYLSNQLVKDAQQNVREKMLDDAVAAHKAATPDASPADLNYYRQDLVYGYSTDFSYKLRDAEDAAVARLVATPEYQRLNELVRRESEVDAKANQLHTEADGLLRSYAESPFGGETAHRLVLRHMIAYAAKEGFDKLAWDSGNLQAVRNHKWWGKDLYGPDWIVGVPEPAPAPVESEFSRKFTYVEKHFQPPRWPEHRTPHDWENPEEFIDSGAMDETYVEPRYHVSRGHLIVPAEGKLAGQLTKVMAVDEGKMVLRPTGITRISFDGKTHDSYGSYGEMTREVDVVVRPGGPAHTATETFQGGIREPADFMRDVGGGDPFNPGLFEDMNDEAKRSQRSATETRAYQEAVREWEVTNAAEVKAYEEATNPERLNQYDMESETPEHARWVYDIYDRRLVREMNKIAKKYKVQVREGRRRGSYDRGGTPFKQGPVKVWEIDLPKQMRDDALKNGFPLWQGKPGKRKGASWKAPAEPLHDPLPLLAASRGRSLAQQYVEAQGRVWETPDWPPRLLRELGMDADLPPEDIATGQMRLFQRQHGEPVGASWNADTHARRMVALLEGANVSTWVHEVVGHGTDELKLRFPDEFAAVEKAMKKPHDQWGVKEHEKFATWSERYFREGKAPTPESAPFMAELKKWMRQVYHSILALGRPIPKEARDLLDRYLGKKGEGSVFTEREQAVLQERGELHARRQELIKAERDRKLAQPDADMLDLAHTLMVDGEPPEQQAAYSEIAKRRKGKEGSAKPSEEQRLLQRQIRLLDDAIRSADDPKSGFADALAALVAHSEHADEMFRKIIIDMAPDDAKAGIEQALAKRRNILVNRWREQGLLPYGTGDALGYFPHASIFESLGAGLKGPVRQPQGSRRVIGKAKVTPQAVRKGQNLLRLYQSGHLNIDPTILLNTVNARLRLLQTREARDVLWNMGKPVKSEADIQPGWWVINREGKHVPERLRRAQEMTPEQMDEMVAAGEDFDSNVETRKGMDNFLTDYASSFARPGDQVPSHWWGAGELRAVPPEIVNGLLPKPFQGKPGGVLGTTVGLLNAAARVATILQYPIGYILSNVPANLMMQGLTHPSALIRDNPRALALRRRNPKLYHQLAHVAGDIMAGAGLPEFYAKAQSAGERTERAFTKGQKALAEKYGEVADAPFRVGTLLGYARRYGVTTDEQLAKLVKGDGAMGDLRDTLGQKTRDDLIDFNTLTQTEKETVARYFFLWPLVRGMAKWPVTFARDHPFAAAAIGQAGSADFERKHAYGRLGTAAQRAQRHINIVPVGAHRAIDISSVNPLGGLETIQNMLNAPEKLTRGDLGGLRDALAAMSLPQIRELFRNNPSARAILESSVPGAKYVTSSVGKSRGSKIWKREKWWSYMLERNVRFEPEEIDAAMMRSQADRDRRAQTGTTASEERSDAEYNALPKILTRVGITDPSRIKAVHEGFEAYNYVASRTGKLDDAGRVRLVNDAIRQFYPQFTRQLREPSTMTPVEQKAYYNSVRNDIYQVHRDIISAAEQIDLKNKGTGIPPLLPTG